MSYLFISFEDYIIYLCKLKSYDYKQLQTHFRADYHTYIQNSLV